MPELSERGQSENVGKNRDATTISIQVRGSGKRGGGSSSSGPFSCMNWSIMEWRACRGFVMPSSVPPDVASSAGRQAAPWGHKLCRNFKYPLYFLPVPKMGAKSRRDGVIAKCEKSRAPRGEREREREKESVNIFAAKIRSASLKAFRGCRRRLT